MYNIDTIKSVFAKDMNRNVCSVHQFENVENNSVYRIETESQPYIFKVYNNSGWPEDGKLLLVDRLLTEHEIPHAKIFVYNRDNANFPNGYLIEECLPGVTADRIKLSKEELVSVFQKLGALVSRLHKIKMTGYGYTGAGVALWSTFSEFMYDSMGDNKKNLLAHNITDEEELECIGQEFWSRLKVCDKYPPVLCHTDLSTKNILIHNGDIALIDWDDVYSLPWIHDIAELTFWLKREYGSESEIYRNAFLNNYQTEYDMSDFYNIEPVLHARIGIGGLNYFIGKPQEKIIKQLIKESLEKCGMRTLKCLLKSMEIRYIPHGTITEKQQKDVDFINKTCLSGESDEGVEFDESTYEYSAPEDGMFLIFDGERAVGRTAVHKVLTEYDGQEYYLGGFGGLAVLPHYQGKGYARKLSEAALEKASEIGIDVVCMEANTESGITKFYENLGFAFLNRPAYFINHGNNEVTDNNVMIMGLRNKELANKILTTNHKFHYGKSLGHW